MLLLIVDLTALPGKRDELVAHVHALLGDGADGLLQYTIGTREQEPDAIAIVEEWQDAASHVKFMATETFAAFVEASRALNAGPPVSREFEIDVPNKTTISLL
jgi:quinol monooxygenase YgiN